MPFGKPSLAVNCDKEFNETFYLKSLVEKTEDFRA